MIGGPLPYQDDAETRDEAAMAFAAAGAIAAMGGLESGDRGLLDSIGPEGESLSIDWTLPFPTGGAGSWGVTAQDLAQSWQALFDRFDPALPRRLIVRPRAPFWHRDEIHPSVAAAMALGWLALSGRAAYDDWRSLAPGYLGAVALSGSAPGYELHWNWPPRTLVAAPGSGINPDHARYGAETVHLDNQWAGYDIGVLDDALGALGFGGGNFNVAFDPFPDPFRLADLLARPDLNRPLAILPLASSMGGEFHQRFINEISHNAPYDVAFFKAAVQIAQWRIGQPVAPLVLAPWPGFLDQMDRSRLLRRVSDLLYDLPAIAEYGGVDSVTLPFDAPDFGLFEGPVSLPDLQAAVETALSAGWLRFDAESRTGTSLWSLDIATRDLRGGFGSVDEDDAGDGSAVGSSPVTSPAPSRSGYGPDGFGGGGGAPSAPSPSAMDFDALFEDFSSRVEESEPAAAAQSDESASEPEAEQVAAPEPEEDEASVEDFAVEEFFAEELGAEDDDPALAFDLQGPGPSLVAPEAPRYTSLDIFPGLVFGNDGAPAPLTDTTPLEPRGDYTLRLALKAERSGIAAGNTPQAATPVRRDREMIRVYAIASCDWQGGPRFVDPLQSFDWDYDRDTVPVFFRFTMPEQAPWQPPPITVRLYSAQLHLLDVVTIQHASEGGGMVRRLYWDQRGVSPTLEDSGIDALAFHVTRRPGGYHVEAAFSRGGDVTLQFDPQHLISTGDLDTLLAAAREFWTTNALSTFATRMSVSSYGYKRDVLPGMIALGHRAWRALFGSGVEQTAQRLGGWIADLGLAEGTVIRVTTADDAKDFVFPWQLMLPPDSDDPADFWGLRYPIEITRKYGPPLALREEQPTRVDVVVDDGFRTQVDHPATLDTVFETRPDVLRVPLTTGVDVLSSLVGQPAADLIYFFCHGSTGRRALAVPDDLKRKLESEIGDAADWRRDLLNLVASDSAEARIKTDTFTLAENDIRSMLQEFTPRRPIVFLNMCHSADLMPGQSDGLTRLFLDFGSAAVLGTECPMNAHFADAFAAEVLGRLLQDQPLGEALRQARVHFHQSGNLLGFAYTLYGHADATLFTTAPLYPTTQSQENSHDH